MNSHHHHGSSPQHSGQREPLEPRRLELSLNPEDGSLLTAPLSMVLLAATDGLYQDLYNMAHGELDVAPRDTATEQQQQQEEESAVPSQQMVRRDKMSNLSFAERRHELAWRLAQHSRSLQHVAALCAATASSDLARQVRVSSTALQHARTAWVQADEAQDALYFFHAQLFPARAAPHDVYGAADVMLQGRWWDLPTDLRLSVDRYETSRQSELSRAEVNQQWQLSVRDKLLTGEVGWMRRITNSSSSSSSTPTTALPPGIPPLWKLSIRGGIVTLTHGMKKTSSHDASASSSYHPITALLTVMSASEQPEWTLLSLEVHVQAKTGEFNHQLETSNRQRYDLHKLAAIAMSREEARARLARAAALQEEEDEEMDNNGDDRKPAAAAATADSKPAAASTESTSPELVARPLHALFQVAHTFSLSWQLELLSAQAQALRRGAWAAAGGETTTNAITVTPVRFYDEPHDSSNSDDDVLGEMSIGFWKVDDSYGPPSICDLTLEDDSEGTTQQQSAGRRRQKATTSATNQFVLQIRAESHGGVKVALSGGGVITKMMKIHPHVRATTQELLVATSDPLALSASDALLAATRLCAERKCHAAVQALQPDESTTTATTSANSSSSLPAAASSNPQSQKQHQHHQPLPDWMFLSVERGSISIAARVSYHGLKENEETTNSRGMPVLFRLCCDARTGSFVATFPRSTAMLRNLAGHGGDAQAASESMALRIASLPPNRRRAAAGSSNSSGRIVRDTFDGLIRSMNVLGQRVGVGGTWDDTDDKSWSIRERSIASACKDVRVALVKCCGIAALYGLTPLAFGTAFGLQAMADMAGEPIKSPPSSSSTKDNSSLVLFPAPPVSILLDQRLVNTSTTTSDGVTKRGSYLEQSLFAVACSANESALTLVPFDILAKRDSPMALTERQKHTLLEFNKDDAASKNVDGDDDMMMNGNETEERPRKRAKRENGGAPEDGRYAADLMGEVERFTEILTSTVNQ